MWRSWLTLALLISTANCATRYETLVNWIQGTDIQLSGVALKDFGGKQAIGLVSTKDIQPGETLVTVPMDLVLRY